MDKDQKAAQPPTVRVVAVIRKSDPPQRELFEEDEVSDEA